jgi:hypothetical protein
MSIQTYKDNHIKSAEELLNNIKQQINEKKDTKRHIKINIIDKQVKHKQDNSKEHKQNDKSWVDEPPPYDPDNIIKNMEDTNYEMLDDPKYIKYIIDTMQKAFNNQEDISKTIVDIIGETIQLVHCNVKYLENHNLRVPSLEDEVYQFKMAGEWYRTSNPTVLSTHILGINGKILMAISNYMKKNKCDKDLMQKIIIEFIKSSTV